MLALFYSLFFIRPISKYLGGCYTYVGRGIFLLFCGGLALRDFSSASIVLGTILLCVGVLEIGMHYIGGLEYPIPLFAHLYRATPLLQEALGTSTVITFDDVPAQGRKVYGMPFGEATGERAPDRAYVPTTEKGRTGTGAGTGLAATGFGSMGGFPVIEPEPGGTRYGFRSDPVFGAYSQLPSAESTESHPGQQFGLSELGRRHGAQYLHEPQNKTPREVYEARYMYSTRGGAVGGGGGVGMAYSPPHMEGLQGQDRTEGRVPGARGVAGGPTSAELLNVHWSAWGRRGQETTEEQGLPQARQPSPPRQSPKRSFFAAPKVERSPEVVEGKSVGMTQGSFEANLASEVARDIEQSWGRNPREYSQVAGVDTSRQSTE